MKNLRVQAVLLPITDFAQIGISVRCARKRAYSGKIASANVGKRLLVTATGIDRLLAENLRPAMKQGAAA